MKGLTEKIIALDRENMSDAERELLRRDLTGVAEEYFELYSPPDIDVTRTDDGFSVCVLLRARRIKKVFSPQ